MKTYYFYQHLSIEIFTKISRFLIKHVFFVFYTLFWTRSFLIYTFSSMNNQTSIIVSAFVSSLQSSNVQNTEIITALSSRKKHSLKKKRILNKKIMIAFDEKMKSSSSIETAIFGRSTTQSIFIQLFSLHLFALSHLFSKGVSDPSSSQNQKNEWKNISNNEKNKKEKQETRNQFFELNEESIIVFILTNSQANLKRFKLKLKNLIILNRRHIFKKIFATFQSLQREEPLIINHKKKTLKIDQIIKLLHFWIRFVMKENAENIEFEFFSMLSAKPQTDKFKILIFVELIKDFKKNKIYKKTKTFNVMIERPMHLKINDRKGKMTENEFFSYDFIDALNTNIAFKNVWFISLYKKKTQRNLTTIMTADLHKKHKKKWKKYKKNARSYWIDRLMWKWTLIQLTWNVQNITFSTAHIEEEIMTKTDLLIMKYSRNFEKIMHTMKLWSSRTMNFF